MAMHQLWDFPSDGHWASPEDTLKGVRGSIFHHQIHTVCLSLYAVYEHHWSVWTSAGFWQLAGPERKKKGKLDARLISFKTIWNWTVKYFSKCFFTKIHSIGLKDVRVSKKVIIVILLWKWIHVIYVHMYIFCFAFNQDC